MLMDYAEIIVRGGHGGAGIVSFGPKEGSGPDGGNGGSGGDFYVKAVNDITALNQFRVQSSFQAQDGFPGGKNRMTGKDGDDFELQIPVGSTITDRQTKQVIIELDTPGQRILLCSGGKGGRGNYEFRSPRRTTPRIAQKGIPGEVKKLAITLKLIADFGLVGLPNAGKSSLLNELTAAKAKTANYAFTTLSPNLGVISGKVIADIPGLVEGASQGKGLGISFLKHIEKVSTILHCVSSESQDPMADYETVRSEMGSYNKKLLDKPEVILITKSDLVDEKQLKSLVKQFCKKSSQVLPVSIHDWDSLEKLKKVI